MKKMTIFSLCKIGFWVSFTLHGVVSADTIFLKNGDTLKTVTLAEITPTEVKYKIGERTVVYSISKSDVLKVVYNDGSEDVFGTQPRNQSVAGAEPPAQYTSNRPSSTTYVIHNSAMDRHDTVGYFSFKYAYAWARNYKVSAGYSGVGFNAFVSTDMIRRMRRFREETLLSDKVMVVEYGLGLVEKGILALSYSGKQTLKESDGFDAYWGFDYRLSWRVAELAVNLEFLYKQWLFSVGLSEYLDWGRDAAYDPFGITLSLSAGYFIKEINKSELSVVDIIKHKRRGSAGTRYFRPGIELNYPVYRSEIAFFNNEFPYASGGAGLFFRIGPENVYLTTGAYAKLDYLWRDSVVSAQLNGPFGITIARLPLLDISWQKFSVEVPALLSFGAGQIRFSGGMLFDFYAVSEFNVTVNEHVPIIGGQNVISANDIETFEKRFGEAPTGSMYVALGLDFDIVRYWGLGVKLLILTDSFGDTESYQGFKPSELQTRISTYFVF